MRLIFVLCFCVMLFTATAPMSANAATAAIPLERIFKSDDFQSQRMNNVQWSADGANFTFTRPDAKTGRLNIYEQSTNGGSERTAISYDQLKLDNEPVKMSGYQWAPDKRTLLVRGVNQRTWDSVMQAPYYLYDTKTKALTTLADGNATLRNVSMSPNGQHVGYVLDNDLYAHDVKNGTTIAVTNDGSENIFNGIFDYGSTEFGFLDAWHWSPDGKKIAFWRLDATEVPVFWMIDELGKYNEVRAMKYPNTAEKHAINQIGIYDLGRKKTRWMQIGSNPDDYIPRIDWAPSSQTLAIQRLNRTHKKLDLLFADVDSGKSRTIVTDTDPAWIDITTDLKFIKGGSHFVWTSEKSGYRHAYLYDLDGTETQLTRGDWSINALIGVDEAGEWLYFTAKKDSFINQVVYRTRVSGSDVERVSTKDGWTSWSMSPDGSHVIEEYSNAQQPPRFVLRKPGEDPVKGLIENSLVGLSKYDVPAPEFFQFDTDDGQRLNAYMIKPTDFDATKKYPVIAYGYGNAGSQMVVNKWGSSRGMQRDLWHRAMAQRGYIIFCMDNRTTAGRGKKAKNLTYGEYGKWAVLDQLQGVEYLKTQSFIDAERLGFWGWSGGGYLTAAMMTKGAPHYKVGVSVAPVIDLINYQAVGVERWMGQLSENQEGYDAVNIMNFVDRLEGDLLLIHGTGDENVKFAFTLQLVDAFIKAGKQLDMMVYPNEHHGIEGARHHVYTKIASYFDDKL